MPLSFLPPVYMPCINLKCVWSLWPSGDIMPTFMLHYMARGDYSPWAWSNQVNPLKAEIFFSWLQRRKSKIWSLRRIWHDNCFEHGGDHMARNVGSPRSWLGSLADIQQGNGDFSPETSMNWIQTIIWISLEVDCSQTFQNEKSAQPMPWFQIHDTLSREFGWPLPYRAAC